MKKEEAEFIIDCLSKDRTIFHYYRDRYAVELLNYYLGSGKAAHQVKQSQFGRLLQKPSMKDVLACSADGKIVPDRLEPTWPRDSVSYTLTLDLWGSKSTGRWSRYWHQTSRPGYNLALQLNFPESHNRMYRKLIKPDDCHPFGYESHPVNKDGKITLGWARMDIDLEGGQALIEEIQNDWIRDAIDMRKWFKRYHDLGRKTHIRRMMHGAKCSLAQMNRYVDRILKPFTASWDEAILCAAIRFIRAELGIRKIFYHTFESGKRIKSICGSPPRSLYTTLPKKFCFRRTRQCPEFLRHKLYPRIRSAKRPEYRFFVLEI